MSARDYAITGLDHVQLAAPEGCESAARAYYSDLLGLTEVPKPPALAGRGGVWFQAGAQGIHIGVESSFAPARKAHPALIVRNLDALAARLTAAGVEVTWDADLPGYRRFYAHDPWGNRLEFLSPE